MNDLVYPREQTLSAITLVLGLLAWLGLIVGTFGIALLVLGVGFVLYVFAQSALIAHIKGNGVELSETQFPDLYAQFTACCERLQIKTHPKAYILNGNGGLNAFATKFLGKQFVVLMSDVVDAMDKHDDGVRFYIGHELGHLRMKHLSTHLLRWPVLWMPLLGAAYSRACESTCDRHGLACSGSPDGAARALAALSAGSERWKNLDTAAYFGQAKHASGFWMSFHELTAGYPWLTKRAARMMHTEAEIPKRNTLSYFLAIFVPYAGRLGAGFGMLILVYIVGVMAAIAIPAYQDYMVKARISSAISSSQPARDALAKYYLATNNIPKTLETAGVEPQLAGGVSLSLDTKQMALTVGIKEGDIVFTPSQDDNGAITWSCKNGEGIKPNQLPPSCKE